MTAERLRGKRTRRTPRRRAGARRRVALALLLLLLGIGGGLAASRLVPALARAQLPSLGSWLRGERFRLRHVDWLGLRTLDGPALVAALEIAPQTPLVDLDVSAVLARLAKHPRIAHANGVRIPPDRLLLSVEERTPIAVLAGGSAGVDAGGARFSLAPGEALGLPELRGETARALPLLVAARERGLALASVSAAAPGDVRFRPSDLEVDVRVGVDPARALQDWERVAKTGLVRGYGAGEVDLRFANGAVLRSFASKDEKGGKRDGSQ